MKPTTDQRDSTDANGVLYHDLDRFVGLWSSAEAEDFDESLLAQRINEKLR